MKKLRLLALELLVNHKVGRVTPCAPFDWFAHILGAQRTARPTTPGLWSVFLSRAFVITTASLMILCPASARAQGGVPLWTNFFGGGSIAVGSNGNVFVSGSLGGTVARIAFSADGLPLWTNLSSGSWLAVDSSGNVFVTGGSGANGNNGIATDLTTLAYSDSGVPLWTNRYRAPQGGNSYGRAIAVDRNGNVFVTGQSGNDYVTIKYSSSVLPPRLDFQKLNNELVLSWTNAGFHLQSAPAVTAPFTNLPGATSPCTNSSSGVQQFFRLIGN